MLMMFCGYVNKRLQRNGAALEGTMLRNRGGRMLQFGNTSGNGLVCLVREREGGMDNEAEEAIRSQYDGQSSRV